MMMLVVRCNADARAMPLRWLAAWCPSSRDLHARPYRAAKGTAGLREVAVDLRRGCSRSGGGPQPLLSRSARTAARRGTLLRTRHHGQMPAPRSASRSVASTPLALAHHRPVHCVPAGHAWTRRPQCVQPEVLSSIPPELAMNRPSTTLTDREGGGVDRWAWRARSPPPPPWR